MERVNPLINVPEVYYQDLWGSSNLVHIAFIVVHHCWRQLANISRLLPTLSKRYETGILYYWCPNSLPPTNFKTCIQFLGQECLASAEQARRNEMKQPERWGRRRAPMVGIRPWWREGPGNMAAHWGNPVTRELQWRARFCTLNAFRLLRTLADIPSQLAEGTTEQARGSRSPHHRTPRHHRRGLRPPPIFIPTKSRQFKVSVFPSILQ